METSAELKNELHKLVVETNDSEVLNKVKEFFLSITQEEDWWANSSNQEKNLIDKGIDQLNNGDSLSHEEVIDTLNKRFKV